MDNPKVDLRETSKFGKGLFANEDIAKGEIVAEFDGRIYEIDYPDWNDELEDHIVQFERYRWRDSNGMARYINHSCEPNCGVKKLFKIIAMKDIEKGQELTWDYEMTEDNDEWRMNCQCGNSNCRKIIGAHRNMPEEIREKYKDYISEWLLKRK